MELVRKHKDLKLSFLNQAAQAWVEQDYHRRFNREIQSTPLDRLLNGKNVARNVPETEVIHLAFTRRVTRKPRRSDATVAVGGIRYGLPARFGHMESVILRFPSWDRSQLTLVDPRTDTPLAQLMPQDKTANASGKRRVISPEISLTDPVDTLEYPALLKKWMADHAATGLPPAYLPKEENTIE